MTNTPPTGTPTIVSNSCSNNIVGNTGNINGSNNNNNNNNNSDDDDDDDSNAGVIVAGVMGGLIVILLIAILIVQTVYVAMNYRTRLIDYSMYCTSLIFPQVKKHTAWVLSS